MSSKSFGPMTNVFQVVVLLKTDTTSGRGKKWTRFLPTNPCRAICQVNYRDGSPVVSLFPQDHTSGETSVSPRLGAGTSQTAPNYCFHHEQSKAEAALITALPDLKDHRLPRQQVTLRIWNSVSLGGQIRTMNGFPPSWWLVLWHFDKRAPRGRTG